MHSQKNIKVETSRCRSKICSNFKNLQKDNNKNVTEKRMQFICRPNDENVERLSQLSGVDLCEVKKLFENPSINRSRIEEITSIAIKNGNDAILYAEFLIERQKELFIKRDTKIFQEKQEKIIQDTPNIQEGEAEFVAAIKRKREALIKKPNDESDINRVATEIKRIRAQVQQDPHSLINEKRKMELEYIENSTVFSKKYGDNAPVLLRFNEVVLINKS
jgi:hypothetical protein